MNQLQSQLRQPRGGSVYIVFECHRRKLRDERTVCVGVLKMRNTCWEE